ncbi:conserved membrane hypothetical protein [Flavobacterium sp. 9AF]|uniref:glycosyltransferase family 87 protein n=1 Tax=Flavobacterium sp. 9AF TaxID=2653142 RepID=UPI0012F33073|nr:glycosyltransferase family 87 protein [Flavobacterium sp. 9AF]VXC12857.1 conserved membrane hypothetical protein [Flavobacterium sp. 9AF]
MNLILQFKKISQKPFFQNSNYISAILLIIAALSAGKQFLIQKCNNYLIYKNVFYHTIHQTSLYAEYPNEYFDHNHYGPVFSLLIAPFALLPDAIGMVLWSVFNAFVLIWAIHKLPIKSINYSIILWIILNEFITTTLSFQINPIMTAIIIMSFVSIQEEKEGRAAFFIMLGTFIKLYGIVGLAFFFFSKHKLKFILYLITWSLVFYVLPMILATPEFINSSYIEWFERLVVKNGENTSLDSMQDISFMGIIRRVVGNPMLSNLPFLLFGLLVFGLPYLRIKMYKDLKFRLLLLCSVLLFTVIFSSGSESPTYIIAFTGIAIWFIIQNKPISKFSWFLLIFALIVTSLSATDLFPKILYKSLVKPYALKALPCVLIWFKIIYEMMVLKKEESIKVTESK